MFPYWEQMQFARQDLKKRNDKEKARISGLLYQGLGSIT
jgi:hypothetical protein